MKSTKQSLKIGRMLQTKKANDNQKRLDQLISDESFLAPVIESLKKQEGKNAEVMLSYFMSRKNVLKELNMILSEF